MGLDALTFSVVSSCVFCRIAVVAALAVVPTVAYAVWFGWLPCVWQHCLVRQWIPVHTSSTVVFFVPVYLAVTCSVLVLPEVRRTMVFWEMTSGICFGILYQCLVRQRIHFTASLRLSFW